MRGTSRATNRMPYRPTARPAQLLGPEIAEFPGGHIGYDEQPAEFAAELRPRLRPGR